MSIPIPADSYYQKTFDYHLQEAPSSYKNDIWQKYLTAKGYSTPPTATEDVKNDFKQFLITYTSWDIQLGAHASSFKNALWQKFMDSQGYTVLPPITEEITNAFKRFFQTYISLGITESALDLDQAIPTSPSFYKTYMSSFYGNLPESVQKDLWCQFLLTNGYTANPPDFPTLDSPEMQTLFATFIQQKRAQAYSYEAQTALSPLEIQKRIIFSKVLDGLARFLSATQDLVKVQAALLIFYGRWQQEYTKAMTQVPTLSKGMPGAVTVGNLTSTDDYKFGYGGICLTDVIRWGYTNAVATEGRTFTFGNARTGMGAYSFTVSTTGTARNLKIAFTRNTDYTVAKGPSAGQVQNVNWNQEATISLADAKDSTKPKESATAITDTGKAFLDIFKNLKNTSATDTRVQASSEKSLDFKTVMNAVYVPDVADWALKRMKANPNATITFGNVGDATVPSNEQFQVAMSYFPKESILGVKNLPNGTNYLTGNNWFTSPGNLYYYPEYYDKIYVERSNSTSVVTGSGYSAWFNNTNYHDRSDNYGPATDWGRAVTPTTKIDGMKDTLSDLIANSFGGIGNLPTTGVIGIPGQYLGTSATGYTVTNTDSKGVKTTIDYGSALDDSDYQARGEVQAVLTQYSSTFRMLRDQISDLSSRQQSALTQAKDSIAQQADLYTSILETIQSIMSAILKK